MGALAIKSPLHGKYPIFPDFCEIERMLKQSVLIKRSSSRNAKSVSVRSYAIRFYHEQAYQIWPYLAPPIFDQRISPSTRAIYQSGWCDYHKFCAQFGVTPLPLLRTPKLLSLLTFSNQSVSARTCHHQVLSRAGLPDLYITPKLSYGIQRSSLSRIQA